MKNRKRIPRRAIRSFLHLSTIAFAFTADPSIAVTENQPSEQNNPDRHRNTPDDPDTLPYQHRFTLTRDDAEYPAKIQVNSPNGENVLSGVLHLPGKLGPLPHGAYSVIIKARSGAEIQQVRIGPDTDQFLNFVSEEKQPTT